MCGIAGYVGQFDQRLLDRMKGAINHRGPDDQGAWFDVRHGVALAHARLSIIDLSPAGHQPMTNEDGTLWLVYNGELYNFSNLKQELLQKGHRFRSRTDTEILLHLYEEEGVEMVHRLNGIFAFALWDGRTQELFLSRDAMGVKPLYWSEVSRGFLFASELKSLLACPSVSRDLDYGAISQYLTYLWCAAPKTMLKGVNKLEPGGALIVKYQKVRRHWRWFKITDNTIRANATEEGIARQVGRAVERAVERQLMSDVPVGAFLSGGLDSSSVVAMMRRLLPNNSIQCYTIGFEGNDAIDGAPADLPYARRVAKFLNVDLQEIRLNSSLLLERLEEFLWCLDEPQADPAPINALYIAQKAREDGVKVLLSGAGGDDIFSGYRRHTVLGYERYWAWLPYVVRRMLARSAQYAGEQSVVFRRVSKALSNADRPASERIASYFQWSSEALRICLLSPMLRDALQGYRVEEPLYQSLNDIPDETDPLNQMLYLEMRHFLADHNLNYTDKTSMRYGVEVRVPLLDLDLVRFALKIPSAMKQQGRMGKAIFKKAMEPFLPRDVIYRTKTGFGAPLRHWMRQDLNEVVDDVLSPRSVRERGLFDAQAVGQLIKANAAGSVDGAYTIFSILCIELWCRLFVDHYETSLAKFERW